jgi:hypothetical protein
LYFRSVNVLDANGFQTEEIHYYWDSNNREWSGKYRWIYAYDTKGNQTEYAQYYWNTETNGWAGNVSWIKAYDISGKLIQRIIFDGIPETIIGYILCFSFLYDRGNRTESIQYIRIQPPTNG